MKQTTRTFVALPIERACRMQVVRLIEELRRVFPKTSWVKEENLHITLAFLGSVPTVEIPRICSAVEEAVTQHDGFTLELFGAGAFPKIARPRTIWVGVREGTDAACLLQMDIADRLARIGYATEGRSFVPHLTIGRVREGRRPSADVIQALQDRKDWTGGVGTVASIQVMASELAPAGSIYTVLSDCPLRGA